MKFFEENNMVRVIGTERVGTLTAILYELDPTQCRVEFKIGSSISYESYNEDELELIIPPEETPMKELRPLPQASELRATAEPIAERRRIDGNYNAVEGIIKKCQEQAMFGCFSYTDNVRFRDDVVALLQENGYTVQTFESSSEVQW